MYNFYPQKHNDTFNRGKRIITELSMVTGKAEEDWDTGKRIKKYNISIDNVVSEERFPCMA